MERGHLLGELVLRSFTGAGASKNGEFQGVWLVRQSSQGFGGRLLRGWPDRRRDKNKDEEKQKLAHGFIAAASV
ncbi:MAG: hypothetical protein WD690_18290 [Vicinamibacterales bacterium]